MKHHATVVGGGLTGPLISIFLARRGYQVEMFDSKPDSRLGAAGKGGPNNLALSERGIFVLKELELFDSMEPYLTPMPGRMIHRPDGTEKFQPYSSRSTEQLYSVPRVMLNHKLLDFAENQRNIKMYFNHRCTSYHLHQRSLHFFDPTSREEVVTFPQTIFAADGAFSVIRKSMQSLDRFSFSQEFLDYGYREIQMPALTNGIHRMEKNALHIWPRKNFMLIALPNHDGSFTCTLFLKFEGEESFSTIEKTQDARTFFQTYFPDALKNIPDFDLEYTEGRTGSMVTIRCHPWHLRGEIVLVGDSAHAISPFLGQGMNAAFEDCYLLDQCLDQENDVLEKAFKKYFVSRKEDTDAIADMAFENFGEMRDLVSDPKFQLKKAIERELEKSFPDKFRSKYALVSFSRVPYSEVLKTGEKNEQLLQKIMEKIESIDQITPENLKPFLS